MRTSIITAGDINARRRIQRSWAGSLISSNALNPNGNGFGLEQSGSLDDSVAMIAERIPELKRLSPDEKLILVGELWEELAAQPDVLAPREDHIALLKERLEHFRQHPEDVVAGRQ